MKKVLWLIVCLMTMVVFTNCQNKSKDETKSVLTDSIKKDSLKRAVQLEVAQRKDALKRAYLNGGKENSWNYEEKKDPMTDNVSKFATIVSKNSENIDFPYGNTFVKIVVRKTPRWGTDVMVIANGQIYGNEYNGENYILVRFDKNQAKKYYFSEASDGSSEVVFINKVNDFIGKAKNAKEIKIEVPFFDNGRKIFEFSANESLNW